MTGLLLKSFRKDSRSSQLGSIQKLSILIILAGCFIVLVTFLAGFALDRVKEKLQTEVGDALQIVLQTTQESLNIWVESNKFQLIHLAEDPRLVSLIERQLRVSPNKSALLKSDALPELRAFFRPPKKQFGQAGFFIISPDLINIGSMRDGNLGARNLIANQALDLLNRAFRGEALMVPPIWSDIPLITALDGKNKMSPSMFFAAPIKNKQGRVIAVVTQRVDPSLYFTRIIQLGRIGESGETYAFGLYGKLLSKSRFEEDLFKAGLLGEGQKSILAVSVRDPGGDLTQGFIPPVPRYQQPLTLMAEQATRGKAGLNVEGYRDYRGVPVYGAWLWDAKLGIGLTTEIDEVEALGPYFTTRTVILTVLGITVFLALGSLVFAVVIEARASRALQKSNAELENRVEERTTELKNNQARLEQAEERSRGLLDATKESLLLLDKEGIIIAVNQTAARRHQRTPEELVRTNYFDLLPQKLGESRKTHFSNVMQTGNPADFEDVRDGMVFHLIYYPVQDKAGAIMGVAIFAQDITERKRAEEAIRESRERLSISQQRLKIALESSNTGVWTFDPQINATTFKSEQWYKQIGYQRDDFKADQDPFTDLLHPDDKAATLKAIEDHIEGVTQTYEKEFRLKSKDGTWRWILSKGQITKRDSDGKVTEMTGVHLDITERRHMEDEVRRNLEELELFNKLAIGREIKMIQIKQEINELRGQLGQSEKYEIVK